MIEIIDYTTDFGHLKNPEYWEDQQVLAYHKPMIKIDPKFPNDFYAYSHFECVKYSDSNFFDFLFDASPYKVAVKFYCGKDCVREDEKPIEWMFGFQYNTKYEIEELLYKELMY